jgi:hypothetical protein
MTTTPIDPSDFIKSLRRAAKTMGYHPTTIQFRWETSYNGSLRFEVTLWGPAPDMPLNQEAPAPDEGTP